MTTTISALGQWPKAPLALVVAQVRFEPNAETEQTLLVGRIHETTGGVFPTTTEVRQFSFVVGEGGMQAPTQEPVVVALDLRSTDGSRSIRVQPGAITYSTSSYKDSRHFAKEWQQLLDALCASGEVRALRLGLRYVDFIIPTEGHVPEDYVTGLGCSPAALGAQSPIAFVLYDFERDHGGRLRVQYGRGYGPPSLPPDLIDSVPPPAFLVAKYNSGLSAVLDMDRWRPVSDMMSAAVIAGEFQVLREDMASAFHSIISPFARNEWQGEPLTGV